MIHKAFVFTAFSITLSACSVTYPVVGVADRTGERFFGTATSAMSGASNFEMTNARGVVCSGTYIAPVVPDYATGASIRSNFTCSDGRSGNFVTTGTAVGGQGQGYIEGQPFTVFYGQFASHQQIN
jgi:hypothetical protein